MNAWQRYIAWRLLGTLPVLFGISLLAFILAQLSPGDPAEILLEGAGTGMPSDAEVAALRSYLGLDAPPYVQYGLWLWRLLHGDGGMSYHLGIPVFTALLDRLPVTAALAGAALLWAMAGGIGLGLLMVRLRGTAAMLLRGMAQVMLAVPSFLTAILLILVFGVWLHVLPTNGVESAAGYLLPSLALALVTLAMTAQLLDAHLREALSSLYARTARLRGLSETRVLLSYALPNALVPVTAMLGNFAAAVLGGAIIVETVFALPGIGSLALEAIHYRDYPLLQGYVLFLGGIYVLVTLAVDLVLARMDPRIALGGER